MVGAWFLAYFLALIGIPAVFLMSVSGVGALVRAWRQQGPQSLLLALFAIQLWEPSVTCGFVALLFATSIEGREPPSTLGPAWMSVTATMLLLPVMGLVLRDGFCRGRSIRLVVLGLVRCSLNSGIFYFGPLPMAEQNPIGLLLLAEVAMFWFSAGWSLRELLHMLRRPPEGLSQNPRLRWWHPFILGGAVSSLVFVAATSGGTPRFELGVHLLRIPYDHTNGGVALGSTGTVASTGRIWRIKDGRMVGSYEPAGGAVALSPSGSLLATTDGSNVNVLRASDQSLAWTFPARDVRALAFSPDEKAVAAACGDNSIELWRDLGVQLLAGHKGRVNSVAFSPDGQTLASGGDDGLVVLWRAGNGSLLRSFASHSSRVASVAFSPDGRTLVSGGSDKRALAAWATIGTIKIWGTEDGSLSKTIIADESAVSAVAIHSGGDFIASGGRRRSRLWRIHDGAVRDLPFRAEDVAFSPDGSMLAACGTAQRLQLWVLDPGGLGPSPAPARLSPVAEALEQLSIPATAVDPPGGLTGVVRTDPPGGFNRTPIPFMTIRFESEDESLVRETTSDERGEYRIALPRGRYRVTNFQPGFEPEESNRLLCWVPGDGFKTADLYFRPGRNCPQPPPRVSLARLESESPELFQLYLKAREAPVLDNPLFDVSGVVWDKLNKPAPVWPNALNHCPVRGVLLLFQSADAQHVGMAISDRYGSYSVALPKGVYRAVAYHQDYGVVRDAEPFSVPLRSNGRPNLLLEPRVVPGSLLDPP